MLRGGWANSFIKSKEGTAVGFLLVWCGRSATTLVAAGHDPLLARAGWNLAIPFQTKFEHLWLSPLDKEKGLSIAAKPFRYLVEAAGLEPASRKPTSSALHV